MDAANCYRNSVSVKLGFADLPEGQSGRELLIPSEDIRIKPDAGELCGPLRIGLKIWRDGDGLVVLGQVDCSVRFACVRCLEEFTGDVRFPFETSFHLRDEPAPVDPWEEGDAPREISRETAQVDLGPDVYDGLILTLPMKPLCRPDCLGLCPVCYGNRNLEECSCRVEREDARWEELKRLREDLGRRT